MKNLNWLLSGVVVLLSIALIAMWVDRKSDQIASSRVQELNDYFKEERCSDTHTNFANQKTPVLITDIGTENPTLKEFVEQAPFQYVPPKIVSAMETLKGIESVASPSSLRVYANELMRKLDVNSDGYLSNKEVAVMPPILFAYNFLEGDSNIADFSFEFEDDESQYVRYVDMIAVDVENALQSYFDNADRDQNRLLEGAELDMMKQALFSNEMDLLYYHEKLK